MKKIEDIENQAMVNHQGVNKQVTVSKDEFDYIIEQSKLTKRYENIISAIANIDTYFMLPNGEDREWNDKEALEEIERMVLPIWNEICERSSKKFREKGKL